MEPPHLYHTQLVRGAAVAQGHHKSPYRPVEPGWLQAGALCGGLSLTPLLTCLGKVILWADPSSTSSASCSGPHCWCPLGHHYQPLRIPTDPHMPQRNETDTKASLVVALVPLAHSDLGPFPPSGQCCDCCPLLFSTESLLPSPQPPTASQPRMRRVRSPTVTLPVTLPSDNEGRPCSVGHPSWYRGA